MLRKRNIVQNTQGRIEKNKETEYLMLLERCSQIPKEERLKLRDKIKCRNGELMAILQRHKKESDLKFLQMELRKHICQNKRQSSENKPINGFQSYRDVSPLQISVEVIPIKTNRIEKEFRKEIEKELRKEDQMMRLEERCSIPSDSAWESSICQQDTKEKRKQKQEWRVPSHKVSAETVCTARNKTFVELTDYELQEKLKQGAFKKDKTNEWYQMFMGKYSNHRFQSQYNSLINQQEEDENNQSDSFFRQSEENISGAFSSCQHYQQDLELLKQRNEQNLQSQQSDDKHQFNRKLLPVDLKLKLQKILSETDTKQTEQLFSFRRKNSQKQKDKERQKQIYSLNQSTGIQRDELTPHKYKQARQQNEAPSHRASTAYKFGDFYRRLQQQLNEKE